MTGPGHERESRGPGAVSLARFGSLVVALALLGRVRVALAEAPESGSVDWRASQPGGLESDAPARVASGPLAAAVIPGPLGSLPRHHLLVGVAVEQGFSQGGFGRASDQRRMGVEVGYRHAAWGPHLRALVALPTQGFVTFSGQFGGGLRAHFDSFGPSLSVGVGAHVEARLRDHVWLAYATPVELGGVIFERHTLRVRLTLGVRRVFAGALINVFLIDPNGFESEGAQEELDRLRTAFPWQTFASLSFSRLL